MDDIYTVTMKLDGSDRDGTIFKQIVEIYGRGMFCFVLSLNINSLSDIHYINAYAEIKFNKAPSS